MNYNIFNDENERKEARLALPELLKHPGWKYIVKALDANAQFVADQLKEKKDFKSLDELYALQDRITDLEAYKELPDNIILELAIDTPEEDLEIY